MSDVKYLAYKSKDSTSIDFINSPGIFIESDLQFNTAIIFQKFLDLVDVNEYVTERIDFRSSNNFKMLGYLDNPDFIEITKEEFQIVAGQFIEFLKKAETLNQIFNQSNNI